MKFAELLRVLCPDPKVLLHIVIMSDHKVIDRTPLDGFESFDGLWEKEVMVFAVKAGKQLMITLK